MMGVIWWGTGGGGGWGGGGAGGMYPTFGSGGIEYLMSPPTFWDLKQSHISILICVLRSFLLDISGPHVLTLYLYSDILSMYSL